MVVVSYEEATAVKGRSAAAVVLIDGHHEFREQLSRLAQEFCKLSFF